MPLSYDLTTFQILGQNLSNSFVGILVQTMTPKGHFEINWPLPITCTYYKFSNRSSSSHTKGKSWASHQLKKMFALLASYFIFAEERAREKRNTIAMVNYTDDGRVIAISNFFTANMIFGSYLGVICFRPKIKSFL